MFTWTWEPSILLGLAGQVIAYLACIGPLRRFFPGSAPVPRTQIQLFLLGTLTMFIALVSPLGVLSDVYLLSAHMIEHLLVTLIAPPLFLLGTPRWLLRPLVMPRIGLLVGRVLTNPVVAFLLFNAVFIAWHFPSFYDLALQNPLIHALEHVMFFATATLTWWPVFGTLDELPRLSDPLKCVYLFLQSIPPTILGAVISFSDAVLYPTYANAPRLFNLSALEDQRLGGLIMWLPGGLIFFVVFGVIFFRIVGFNEFSDART